MAERLLIIDDDARLAAMVSDYLTAAVALGAGSADG